ncbi:histone-like nucleoid-structuring protein Lsr2 [Micromonospora sp. NPDC047730]|uniref:Lsr2 family DNA-binding protein n=1 Tax=Micromonospora sp. NPDC047730 TaxID=3364253 RepID=UPI0037223A59
MTAQYRAPTTREHSVNETTETPTLTATPKEVRAWAKENGHDVGDRGRISKEIKAAFQAATGRLAA